MVRALSSAATAIRAAISLSIRLPVCLPVCLTIYLPIGLPIRLPVGSPVFLPRRIGHLGEQWSPGQECKGQSHRGAQHTWLHGILLLMVTERLLVMTDSEEALPTIRRAATGKVNGIRKRNAGARAPAFGGRGCVLQRPCEDRSGAILHGHRFIAGQVGHDLAVIGIELQISAQKR